MRLTNKLQIRDKIQYTPLFVLETSLIRQVRNRVHLLQIQGPTRKFVILTFLQYGYIPPNTETRTNIIIQTDLTSPPSIRNADPVIHLAAGETRNAMSSTISSGWPNRSMPVSAGKVFIASPTSRDIPGDVEKAVDAAECGERLGYDDVGGCWIAEVEG